MKNGVGDEGLEQPPFFPGNSTNSDDGDAPNDAVAVEDAIRRQLAPPIVNSSPNGKPPISEAVLSPAVARIAAAWPSLPPHIREAIQTLVDAASPVDRDRPAMSQPSKQNGKAQEEAAWCIARECRSIVQSCLREEEWRDADREFFEVIRAGLSAGYQDSL
jgi:hypothetical protein